MFRSAPGAIAMIANLSLGVPTAHAQTGAEIGAGRGRYVVQTALKPAGMLAIGEWLTATSPEEVEVQVSAAGFSLERTETFLEANDMYIYVFRIDDTHR